MLSSLSSIIAGVFRGLQTTTIITIATIITPEIMINIGVQSIEVAKVLHNYLRIYIYNRLIEGDVWPILEWTLMGFSIMAIINNNPFISLAIYLSWTQHR